MKIGIYAGSFNPWHIGHQSIYEQACQLFDKVIIVIAQNPAKPLMTKEDMDNRMLIISNATKNSIVETAIIDLPIKSFLTDLIIQEQKHTGDTFLIRGIRNVQDWAEESNQISYMKGLYPSLKTVYLSCPKELEHVSSSGIRVLEAIKPGSGNKYLI